MGKTLEDPVDIGKIETADDVAFDTLDISKISVEVLPEQAARAVRPFDGYPLKKVKMEVTERSPKSKKLEDVKKDFVLTYFVLHNHVGDPVRQDPSNRVVKTENKGMVKIKTYHGRSVPDILNGNSANILVQFSTPIKTASGVFYGSYVPDHYIRSQIIFKRHKKTGTAEVDKRYMLLDRDQVGRLKQCFQQVINPAIKMEREADFVSGLSQEEPESMTEKSFGSE
jgi:hypothetical protein